MDNFVVSARKYRPITFRSVIGQDHITSTLKNAIARGQLAHAYLFCGPRGVGKTTCARIFAKAINCLSPKDSEACNECESCKAFNEGRSFSIHELDAASNNSVEDIRNLTDQVRIPPQVGRYSVYIIDEVHMLSAAAFNAFLKTLEEPPAHAIFILATTEKHKIIPTILSRCQIYDFNRIKVEDGVRYLKYIAEQEKVSFDDESLHIIAQKADGGMRDALSMYDKVVSFCESKLSFKEVASTLNVLDYDTYFSVTGYILAGDYTSALTLLDEVLRKGFSCQTFVAGLNNHFRDLLMCKDPKTLPLLEVTGSVAERYKAQSGECGVPMLFESINLLTQTDGALRTATSQRLSVELSLMKLCGLGQKKNDGIGEPASPALPALRGAAPGAGQAQSEQAAQSTQPTQPAQSTAQPVAQTQPSAQPSPQPEPSTQPAQSTQAQTVAPSPGPVENTPQESQGMREATPVAPASPASSPAVSAAEPVATTPPAAAQVPARPRQTPSFGGVSINDILNGDNTDAEEDGGEQPLDKPEATAIDDDIEAKLAKACARFSHEMMAMRPRIGVAFDNVVIKGNVVQMEVAGATIRDEILRGKSDISRRLGEMESIHCAIDFDITVVESTASARPIRPEDKLAHLTSRNALMNDLRQRLELEIE